jgi:hypothetical protein
MKANKKPERKPTPKAAQMRDLPANKNPKGGATTSGGTPLPPPHIGGG